MTLSGEEVSVEEGRRRCWGGALTPVGSRCIGPEVGCGVWTATRPSDVGTGWTARRSWEVVEL